MAITLYELANAGDERLSPYCWRVRLALAHKRLTFATRAVGFTEIAGIGNGQFKTVPVLDYDGHWLSGSAEIAAFLEQQVPGAPTLFPADPERRYARFIDDWVTTSVQAQIFRMIVRDVWQGLRVGDQAYFRASREQRLGSSLEDVHATRDTRLTPFRASLEPARSALKRAPYLAGDTPAFVDYVLFGALQWARLASDYNLLQAEDPLCAWFDRLAARSG